MPYLPSWWIQLCCSSLHYLPPHSVSPPILSSPSLCPLCWPTHSANSLHNVTRCMAITLNEKYNQVILSSTVLFAPIILDIIHQLNVTNTRHATLPPSYRGGSGGRVQITYASTKQDKHLNLINT